MKRKLIAVLATTAVLAMALVGCGSKEAAPAETTATEEAAPAEEAAPVEEAAPAEETTVDFGLEMECEPEAGYEEYALVDYTIEALGAEFVATVSKKGDNNYCIACVFYGDQQNWKGTYDGSAVVTESDLTGFMEGDAPAIIQAAIDQGMWAPIQ